MSKSFLYIVGSSDISVNKMQRFSNYYEVTKKLWDECQNCNITAKGFDTTLDKPLKIKFRDREEEISGEISITFPIFSKSITEIKNRDSKFGKGEKDKIFLFVTEQKPAPKASDTKFAGKLIKEFLIKQFKINEDKIKLIEINKNPANYDEMADFFNDFTDIYKKELEYNSTNYVSLTAGTPAQIVNLSLAVNELPVEYLYLSWKEGNIQYYNLFKELNRKKYKDLIKILITNYDYNGALNILTNSPYRHRGDILSLLEMLLSRLQCDFKKAFNYVKDLEFPWKDEISNLAQGNKKTIFCEMIYLIEVYFEKNFYVEAISQLFSLLDNLLQYLFEEITKIEIKKGEFSAYNDYIKSNDQLKKYLSDNGIKWENNPSRLSLTTIIKWCKNMGMTKNLDIEPFLIFLDKIDTQKTINGERLSLLDLRNKLRLAHGYTSVSENLIERLYDGGIEKILTGIKTAMEKLGISIKENAYKQINCYIIDKL